MALISVIIPVYKAEDYLRECVDSVCRQTYKDLEIILVDDGSPDGCPEICDALAAEDFRIRVIHQKNSGVSAARNAGLEAASGEYVTFVDSDDYLEGCMYEKMMEKACTNDCDVVLCDCKKEFPDHLELYTHDIRGGFYSRQQLEQEYFPHLLMMENLQYPATISNCLMLIRRELLWHVRYLEGVRYSEDLLFGAQVMYHSYAFYYLKGEAYYHYRMNPQSASHRFVPDKWNDYLRLYREVNRIFGECKAYGIGQQIAMCLLFFIYNVTGEIFTSKELNAREKKHRVLEILSAPESRQALGRVRIRRLNIPFKQKITAWCFRMKMGIGPLIRHFA